MGTGITAYHQALMTIGKGSVSYARHAARNRYARQITALAERVTAYARHTVADHGCYDLRAPGADTAIGIIRHRSAAADRQQALAVQRPGEIVTVRSAGALSYYYHGSSNVIALVLCPVICVGAFRGDDGRKVRTAVEGVVRNGGDGHGQDDLGQAAAPGKCPISNACHARLDRYAR